MLKVSSIFVLFFITLGPIKTIVPFVALTADADTALCRKVAMRATLVSTTIVLTLCVVGPLILENWGVSFHAVALTGGLILVLLPLQMIMKPEEPPGGTTDRAADQIPTSMLISRLVIPAMITPPGIAAILALAVLSESNQQLWLIIMGLLILVMLVNLLTLLVARRLLAILTVAGLRVIGWVFAVLQASLGMQVMINALRRLAVLPLQSRQ